jgi:hypothetical protein
VPAAEEILTKRGQQPRVFRNTLLFLAPDRRRLAELEQAMRYALAWQWIVDNQEPLDLTPFQRRQSEARPRNGIRRSTAGSWRPGSGPWRPRQEDPQRPHIK